MFVTTLKSLVLGHGSVLRDGAVASVRLGFGYRAESQPREVSFLSMRHGGGEIVAESEGNGARDHNPPVDNPCVLRAGRSVCLAGVLHRRTPTVNVGGTSGLAWRSRQTGGASPTAAPESDRIAIRAVAPVGKTSCASISVRSTEITATRLCPTTFGPSCQSFQQPKSWSKPAGRTPPASTRGRVS